jgi:signal transduction histidine kinase/CheY-like chemotaxis protein
MNGPETGSEAAERRVLILAPTGKDAALAHDILKKAAVHAVVCGNADSLCRHAAAGAAALLIVEETISAALRRQLSELLDRQPAWSDLPILVLTRPGADSATVVDAVHDLGNVSLLERPVRVAALVSLVHMALRARQRQYELRSQLVEQARAGQALREADRRKDDFLATLAHELRNPLAPIRSSLDILRMTAQPDEQVCEMLDRQVSHMVRLVDDLMEVSRITRGKIELRMEPVDLRASILSAVEISQPLIDSGHHQLRLAIPAERLTVHADPIRLTQVFSNLLNNAATHTDAGGRITVAVRREGEAVAISVRDNGSGITADRLPRIFEMFAQFDGLHRGNQAGLGIGLTLVRSLVGMHGGSVAAHSEGLGKGSEFIVTLPLTADHAPAAVRAGEPPADSDSCAMPPVRVLIADDNADAADSLGVLLEHLGAKVRVVHSGTAALNALPAFDPTVVLLDIGMPDMDGYEVAQRIRALPEFRHLVLIALTGWGQEEDRRRSREAGFDHHLTKPTDIAKLQKLMAAVAARKTEPNERGLTLES